MRALTPWTTEAPAYVGWYNASNERNADARRYWHGEYWSAPVYVGDPDGHADRARNTRAETQEGIEWRGVCVDAMDDDDLEALSSGYEVEHDAIESEPPSWEGAQALAHCAIRSLQVYRHRMLRLLAQGDGEQAQRAH